MLDFLGLVADGHLVEDNAIGPHVNSGRNPHTVLHLGCLIVRRSHTVLHICHVFGRVDEMAKTEVADLCDWAIFKILLLFLFFSLAA